MGIIVKNALVEIYHSIGIIKCYHGFLQQIYSIITSKIPSIKLNLALQIFLKAINDLISPDWLVLTLIVFSLYFRMTKLDALSALITQDVIGIKKGYE